MATQVDVSALTLNPEEATQLSQLIIEKEFVKGPLSEMHDIQTGVHHKMQIPFAGLMSRSLKASSGCTPNTATGIALTEKQWDPEMFDARWVHCAADMAKLLKLFQKANRINPDFYDRIGSQEINLVASLIGMMLREDIPEKVWFSDKAAGNVTADGGDIADAVDDTFFQVIDGLWKQIFDAIPSGNEYHVDITENDGASFAAQDALAADKAFDTFVAMVETADERLLDQPDSYIACTRSMADNYRATLRNKTLGAGFIEITEDGKRQLFFDGIPIRVMNQWDRVIKSVFQNGTAYTQPRHRALLTVPGNVPIATVSESDFENLDSFYDQVTKSNYIDVALSLDVKFLQNYMAVAAY